MCCGESDLSTGLTGRPTGRQRSDNQPQAGRRPRPSAPIGGTVPTPSSAQAVVERMHQTASPGQGQHQAGAATTSPTIHPLSSPHAEAPGARVSSPGYYCPNPSKGTRSHWRQLWKRQVSVHTGAIADIGRGRPPALATRPSGAACTPRPSVSGRSGVARQERQRL